MGQSTPPNQPVKNQSFQTTRWSMVLDAARANARQQVANQPGASNPSTSNNDRDSARQALEDLCQIYWYPLYAFARRQGESPDSAMDATQSFFADLLQKSWINRADPSRGRFRSFLVTVFRRFLSDQRKRQNAVKRGGDKKILSIDAASAEQRYRMEPVDDTTPADAFERRWALALLDRVYSRLREESERKDKLEQFTKLQQYLTSGDGLPYETVATQLGMTTSNVKVAVHRLRQRFRKILEDEVSQTVESTADVPSELNALLAALSRGG